MKQWLYCKREENRFYLLWRAGEKVLFFVSEETGRALVRDLIWDHIRFEEKVLLFAREFARSKSSPRVLKELYEDFFEE